MTVLALISQSSLRLEFPGSCFSCYSPQNTNISSYSMRIYHYSMISGQQGVRGAGYWEVNGACWKSGDEPPLCACVVLKRAMLASILQCRRFHWPILMETALFGRRERRLWRGGLGTVGPPLSTGAVEQVALAREGCPPTYPVVSPHTPV